MLSSISAAVVRSSCVSKVNVPTAPAKAGGALCPGGSVTRCGGVCASFENVWVFDEKKRDPPDPPRSPEAQPCNWHVHRFLANSGHATARLKMMSPLEGLFPELAAT